MFGNNQNLLQLNWLSTYMLYQWFRYTWIFHLALSSLVFHLNYGVNKRFFLHLINIVKKWKKERERRKKHLLRKREKKKHLLCPKCFKPKVFLQSNLLHKHIWIFQLILGSARLYRRKKNNGETKIPRKIGLWFFPRYKWISIIFNVHIIWINTLDFYRNFST